MLLLYGYLFDGKKSMHNFFAIAYIIEHHASLLASWIDDLDKQF